MIIQYDLTITVDLEAKMRAHDANKTQALIHVTFAKIRNQISWRHIEQEQVYIYASIIYAAKLDPQRITNLKHTIFAYIYDLTVSLK